jgi:hypothetical protein
MLSTTLLSTPAWADRFAALNLLHDTQEKADVATPSQEWDAVLLVLLVRRPEPTGVAA